MLNPPGIILYSPVITPRLQYVCGFIGQQLTGSAILVTDKKEEWLAAEGTRINYSDEPLQANEYRVQPHGLLSQTGIQPQVVDCFTAADTIAFFATAGDHPFDLFAATFYLLSRYEEYLPHQKDSYGRYAYENSLAWKEGFLAKPIINYWLKGFKNALADYQIQNTKIQLTNTKRQTPNSQFPTPRFTLVPTYDIDIAWSYRQKGFWRNWGGWFRDVLKGNWWAVRTRIRVLRGKEQDPFDSYGWMNQLHEKHQLKPYYFFPLAFKTATYDKNIHPGNKALQSLIRDQHIRYPVGIHPSWQSGDDRLKLKKEIEALAAITGHPVTASRQHYIRFTLPQTFRILLEEGIRFDFSMGYGSINGFRASVASPFYWYDLEKEQQTELLLFPFCYMDANSFYEQQDDPAKALAEMKRLLSEVKKVNGTFIMIWHNTFLGTDPLYKGWREMYRQFIEEAG